MYKNNLAERMRPTNINDVLGQEHILNENGMLYKMINNNYILPLILYGPPGIGKTTIGYAIGKTLNLPLEFFNASVDGKKELQKIASKAIKNKDEPTILILDEIHRLDKPKQDYLLPLLESNDIIIIGATTENPFISTSPAIRSRCQIIELKPLSIDNIVSGLKQALSKDEILKSLNITISNELLSIIASRSLGDLRRAYHILEILAYTNKNQTISLEDINTILQTQLQEGDKNGDTHYNLLSALQKSIRGSDADASLYYLVKLLNTGDLETAVRRLSIIAYEDIGLANPEIWTQVKAGLDTALSVGLPEAGIPLSAVTTLLALSPKSNWTYNAYKYTQDVIKNNPNAEIPDKLKDSHYKGADTLNRGVDYKYPHNYPYHIVPQTYMPENLKDLKFYETTNSKESNINDWIKRYQATKEYLKS